MKTINEQINPKFVEQANRLTQITQFLHNILPVECRNHVRVANVRQQILMLITDSPVWTTRLRQLSPQILQYIHENSSKFDTCFNDAYPTGDHADNKKVGNKQIIHHVQISTRYHKKNTDEQSSSAKKDQHRPDQSRPQISSKTAELLSQSANSINNQQLKTALLKLARHGNSNLTGSDGNEPSETKR